jgi:GT2 family glycosyltransferase
VNRFCTGLNDATDLTANEVEILCSWNGSKEDEDKLNNTSRYDFHVAQNDPYHFAGNMNGLARKATGEILMLANDDLELDPHCIDQALNVLVKEPNVGLVGARLRDRQGRLTHAGIQFDSKYSSYHPLDRLVKSSNTILSPGGPVAAVTGALQWIRREAFLRQPYNTKYEVCGEDIELCLDIQQNLKQQIWLCNQATAIHESETTRSKEPNQNQNSKDLLRLRARTQNFIDEASADQLRVLLGQQQRESQQLRDFIMGELPNLKANENEQELEQQKVLLELSQERLRLKQEIELLRGGLK